MNNRIREIRQHNNLSMKAFGDRLGISSAAVSKIETGINAPSEQTIRAICSEFSINRDWLVDGIGEMQVQKPLLPEIIHNLRKYPHVLELLAAMSPEDWLALDALLDRVIDQKNK
jgi:transcriptional regulator with XRE-family HTH domain